MGINGTLQFVFSTDFKPDHACLRACSLFHLGVMRNETWRQIIYQEEFLICLWFQTRFILIDTSSHGKCESALVFSSKLPEDLARLFIKR